MPLPYLKIRGKTMLRRETVEAWLNSEIPAFQKQQKAAVQPASASTTKNTEKRRGRPPRVPDLQKEAIRAGVS